MFFSLKRLPRIVEKLLTKKEKIIIFPRTIINKYDTKIGTKLSEKMMPRQINKCYFIIVKIR